MSRPIQTNRVDKELKDDKITPPNGYYKAKAIESMYELIKKLPVFGILGAVIVVVMAVKGVDWLLVLLMGIVWVLITYTVIKEIKPILQYLAKYN